MKVIEDLKDLAHRANQYTSFSPERRGDQLIKEYSADLLILLEDVPEEHHKWVTEKYVKLLSAWWYSKSRCMSSMITGPSNFPTRRAQKLNNWENGHYTTFRSWRNSIAQKLQRKAAKQNWSLEGEINRLKEEAENLTAYQERMKAANKILKGKLSPAEKLDEMHNIGYQTMTADFLQTMEIFPQWQLTNNRACIKAREARISELEYRLKAKEDAPKETTTNGIRIVENVAENRLQLFFEGIPAPAVRDILKKNGYRWTPSVKCWQAYLSGGKWKIDYVLEQINNL